MNRKKLMIVDDSNIIRNRIERLQNNLVDVVAKARNGREAVEFCKKFNPDIVTMDITMPEMDGLECIQQLVKIKPNIIILVISALNDKEVGINALRYGARGFVCKPFTPQDLHRAMTRALSVEVH